MRYEIGQKIWTFFIQNTDGFMYPFFSRYNPLTANSLDFPKVEFLQLTVTEHVRVPGDWSDETENDGFKLAAPDGKTWYNQYPRASYGQISDTQDGAFELALDLYKNDEQIVLAYLDDVKEGRYEQGVQCPLCVSTYDLCRELTTLYRNVYKCETGKGMFSSVSKPDEKSAALLNKWYDFICAEFERQTGEHLEHYTHMFRGKEMPGWRYHKVVKGVKEAV